MVFSVFRRVDEESRVTARSRGRCPMTSSQKRWSAECSERSAGDTGGAERDAVCGAHRVDQEFSVRKQSG